jgi:uncharacterized protein
MRPLRSLVIFVLVVFLGGALLAPWLYWLVQALAPHSELAGKPFHRYLNRSLIGFALLGMWPLLRNLGATSWREVGLIKPSGQWHRFGAGFTLGFGSLASLAIITLMAHNRKVNDTLGALDIVVNLLGAACTGLGVSVVEEILFRGAVFGGLRRVRGWRVALLVSSMIYAWTHFFERAGLNGPVSWHSGLELLPRILPGLGSWTDLIPGFFSLTLAGALLALAYQRTGNLYFSIGLHAGWVFWLKSYGIFTNQVTDANLWLFGTDKLIDGWLALAILTIALGVLYWSPMIKPTKPREPEMPGATVKEGGVRG